MRRLTAARPRSDSRPLVISSYISSPVSSARLRVRSVISPVEYSSSAIAGMPNVE
ncbi:hypothetical protein ABH926_003416 [Catenulispora sp. GP43]|uniref:hypothetical protein n=1 Tax=Catenulispora sp. GP43 TaxID=3156263 RepID=UPI003511DF70